MSLQSHERELNYQYQQQNRTLTGSIRRKFSPAQRRRLTKKARRELFAFHAGKRTEGREPGQHDYDWAGHDFEPLGRDQRP